MHEPDCLNSITRQIGIEVDKCSSSVEVAFRIAYIFQIPLKQFFRYSSPMLHRALILLSCLARVTTRACVKGAHFQSFEAARLPSQFGPLKQVRV